MIWVESDNHSLYRFSDAKECIKLISQEMGRASFPPSALSKLSEIENILVYPSVSEIREILNTGKAHKYLILSPVDPSSAGFPRDNFFMSHIVLKAPESPFTRELLDLGVSEETQLEKKLGLRIYTTPKTLEKDYIGAERLIKDVARMKILEDLRIKRIAAILLAGTAGSGKTHWAECFAGSTGRKVAVLDIPYFMSLPNPTKSMDEMFDFFDKHREQKYILFMDEIEKMFDFSGNNLKSKNVLGKLLTRLNDTYEDEESNITFVATANEVTIIMTNNPEFVRKGRFDRLYFLSFSSTDDAVLLYDFYAERQRKKITTSLRSLYDNLTQQDDTSESDFGEESQTKFFVDILRKYGFEPVMDFLIFDLSSKKILAYANEKYAAIKISKKGSHIYSPPEIKALADEIINRYMLRAFDLIKETDGSCLEDGKTVVEDVTAFLEDVLMEIIPLQLTASTGIQKQLSQAKNFHQGGIDGDLSPFFEIQK